MIDQLGGWSRQTGGQGYGVGYELRSLYMCAKKIALLSFD